MISGSFKRQRMTAPVRLKGPRPREAVEALAFRGAAAALQAARDREVIIAGPAETGKTFAALYRLDQRARANPRSQWVLSRKLRATMDGTVLNTWRRIIARHGDVAPFGGEKPQWYDYPNGARVWVVGLDKPEKILSGEFDGIYVNQAEELAAADWETLTSRVTGRGAVVDDPGMWADCNPGHADHWIIRRQQSGALRLLESRHEDNPTLFADDGAITEQGRRTLATLDALTGVRYLRLRKGLWVGAEGQFFTEWDEARHVCAPFALSEEWRIWGALDYGFTHPTAFYLLAEHHGMTYVIGEHVAHRWLVPQHADAMIALVRRLAPWLVVDHDDGRAELDMVIVAGHDVFAQKGDRSAATIADQYADCGIRLRKARIERVTGAQRLLQALGNAAAGLAPTLQVVDTCRRLIATMPMLETDPDRPEDVKKVDADADGRGGDDPYDAVRYGLMEVGTSFVSGVI